MKRKIELLAPGGDLDSIKAAIVAGADAVYCGLEKFNARNRAANISFDDLNGILRLAHKHDCQIFITLNIIVVETEIPTFVALLNRLVNTGVDGVILQDLGMLYLLQKYFPSLDVHASTQLTTHNEGQIKFLKELGVSRVNLSRELCIDEIRQLSTVAHDSDMLTEVFVHGSNCICFSGACYISSVHGGNSGNRGRCSQPCRDQFLTTEAGKDFPLNLKDGSAFSYLRQLADAGADSLKIEGRIKKSHYVYTVVEAWHKQLQRFYNHEKLSCDKSELYKVFNRDFTSDFLTGRISKNMFIDNPRDNSAIHLAEQDGGVNEVRLEKAKGDIYDLRTDIINDVNSRIAPLAVAKAPLAIKVSGEAGAPLTIFIKTPDTSFEVLSERNLKHTSKQALDYETLFTRLKAINDTEYFIESLRLEELQADVFIPFKELTEMKKQILFILNNSREFVEPVELPRLKKNSRAIIEPRLSVLISSIDDLYLADDTSSDIYFQLPNSFKNKLLEFVDLFQQNRKLIPWFPSILIGDDYSVAVELLDRLKPEMIVANNTGIAYEAWKRGIRWIAGPHLNIVNSQSLMCLKEKFNCSGTFISNELKKGQIKGIKKPDDFELFYSIYHPIVLMTSRQCLFHHVTGCEKCEVDDDCVHKCVKTATITNSKGSSLIIEKSMGNYHRIFNETNFLNTDVVEDIPNLFSSFFIDFANVKTGTELRMDKTKLMNLFDLFLAGDSEVKLDLEKAITPFTNTQYRKGI